MSIKDRPLFSDASVKETVEEKPKKSKPTHTCAPGKTPVNGFTRKDGKKVAPFCSTKRALKLTLAGIAMLPPVESKKGIEKLAHELGCGEVIRKLEDLAKVTKDERVRERAKEQAEWLKVQPSCKIVREPKEENKKE